MFPGSNWEFTKWTRKDFVGFFGCWAIVAVILLVLRAVLNAGCVSYEATGKVRFAACLMLGLLLPCRPASAAPTTPVALHWLDGAPPSQPQGVSWGVPWPRGAVKPGTAFN